MDMMQISKLNKLLFISKYIGSNCLICDSDKPVSSYIEGIDWINQSVISERVNWDPNIITLNLMSLNNITDYDLIMLSTINLRISNISEEQLISYSQRLISNYLNNNNLLFPKIWESLSYLQLRGYAIPYTFVQNDVIYHLSTKDLENYNLIKSK